MNRIISKILTLPRPTRLLANSMDLDKPLRTTALACCALIATGTPALAQVTTDSFQNVIIGSNVLSNINGGQDNTGAGDFALNADVTGSFNTAYGNEALFNTVGANNTATGYQAMMANGGSNNTAVGSHALSDIGGSNNTAVGYLTMAFAGGSDNTALGGSSQYSSGGSLNTSIGISSLGGETTLVNAQGSYNTASGAFSLYSNNQGNNNTADGIGALYTNANGSGNTASGYQALYSNPNGAYNTAAGFNSLQGNTGSYNTASGAYSLTSSGSGSNNTASGIASLYNNASGNSNVAEGYQALYSNTSGSSNIAIGSTAGYLISTGSNNIDIGSPGNSVDSATIRIGSNQTATYIAGIFSTPQTGSTVVVTSSGKLGVIASSERFKTDIQSMGRDTEKVLTLRPVTFHLKTEPTGNLQYGLIAEEVVKVFPELVIRDDSGIIQGVRYDELAPILLHALQEQRDTVATLEERSAAQAATIVELREQQMKLAATQAEQLQQLHGELAALASQIQLGTAQVARR